MATTAEHPDQQAERHRGGLPDFIVIGAMKSGTTSLHHYLSCHPDIAMTTVKEPTFFTAEGNWDKGLDWYRKQFGSDGTLRGEVSPDYTKFPRHAGVPARMHATLPHAKLIYLVRDPIERLISHYVDAYSFRRANGPLNEVLRDAEGRHYVACSKYFLQLEQYLPFYDFEQFLVVATEDLAARRARRSPASSGSSRSTTRSGRMSSRASCTSVRRIAATPASATWRSASRAGYGRHRSAAACRRA